MTTPGRTYPAIATVDTLIPSPAQGPLMGLWFGPYRWWALRWLARGMGIEPSKVTTVNLDRMTVKRTL